MKRFVTFLLLFIFIYPTVWAQTILNTPSFQAPAFLQKPQSANSAASLSKRVFKGKQQDDYLGLSLAFIGDVNNDGYDDMLISSDRVDVLGEDRGQVYLYFGGRQISNLPDLVLNGKKDNSRFGRSLSSAGDVNGDGYADFMIGTSDNVVYVYFGGLALDTIPDVQLIGANTNENFGCSIAEVGDLNGDGYTDLAVGAKYNGESNYEAGKVYVYFGGPQMDGSADLTILGEASYDHFGATVVGAGDVNNDGYDDLLVAAPEADNHGNGSGRVYLYFGGSSMDNTADWTMDGEAEYDYFGYALSSAGDVNQDGYDDILVGTGYYDSDSTNSGKVYLFYGGVNIDHTADLTFEGQRAYEYFGESISMAGDVNGDGYRDLIVGAKGYSYTVSGYAAVFFGAPDMDNIPDLLIYQEEANSGFATELAAGGDLNGDGLSEILVGAPYFDNNRGKALLYFNTLKTTRAQVNYTLLGEENSDYFGAVVASAGDVNGDNKPDFLISAQANDAADYDEGKVYLYLGGKARYNKADKTFVGEDSEDYFGNALSTAGDVNGDGFDDFLIGAYLSDENGENSGFVSLHYGGQTIKNNYLSIYGENAGDQFGTAVSPAGDLNGDGYADFVVAAQFYDLPDKNQVGKVYIYFGGESPDNVADLTITGENAGDEFGNSVACAGDVNNDGYSDLIVGAHYNDENGEQAGKVYIYFGGADMDTVADVVMNGEGGHYHFGESVAGVGDVNHDGYDDVLIGSPYDFSYGSNPGKAYLFYGGEFMDNTPDVTFTGEQNNDYFGVRVSSAGDINSDGYIDLVISASSDDQAGDDAGKVYIYFGAASMDNQPDLKFYGESPYYQLGAGLAAIGDVNLNGIPDLLIGSKIYDGTPGKAYLYYPSGPSVLPHIYSISDVPGDQGGYLYLQFSRSAYDKPEIEGVNEYLIQRSLKPNYGPYAWESVATITASHQPFYSYTVPTLNDSCGETNGRAYYRVVARSADGKDSWISNVVSAYSLDNLAPQSTQSLNAQVTEDSKVNLNWQKNTVDPDVREYAVYRSTQEGFTPSEELRIATTTDTTYLDENPVAGKINYYKVVTIDIHDNHSDPSPEAAADLSGSQVQQANIPQTFKLAQNFPNPFNPGTLIRYQLPQACRVTLQVYDLLGRKIATLVDKKQEAGYYTIEFKANELPSGLYIYRLQAGNFRALRKMIKLK